MRTDDLIRSLAEDTHRGPALGRMVWLAWAGAAMLAVVTFLLLLGPRPDLADGWPSMRILFKPVVPLTLAVIAIGAAVRLALPGASPGVWRIAFAIPVIAMLAAVGVELMVLPASQWTVAALGHSKAFCLVTIPALSLAPLALILWALTEGASTRPVLTGMVAGLAAAGLAASVYAVYCTEDSPLFVAIWYTGGIAIAAIIGALAGRRVLRW